MEWWQMQGLTSSRDKGWAHLRSGWTITSSSEFPKHTYQHTTHNAPNGTVKSRHMEAVGRMAVASGTGGRTC